MAVSRETLRLVRELRVAVGAEADSATATLTRSWARAWAEVAKPLRVALADVIALQAELGRWPQPYELNRIRRLRAALDLTEEHLRGLATQTGVTVTDAAGNAIAATVAAEPRILASQLPAPERAVAAVTFDRVPTAAIDAIVRRTTDGIVATSRPLSAAAHEAIRRALIRGVVDGTGPRDTARRMLAATEGAFNGGLVRATNVARTETLDAYRAASRASHIANADIVAGYRWQASLDRRSCPSCWAMHGTLSATDDPGPYDHPQGRCARVAVLRPWSELGFTVNEPPGQFPDAQARFAALPADDQLAVMGAARLELLKSGRVDWPDLAQRRTNPGWRPSYAPRPVADLQRRAATPAA